MCKTCNSNIFRFDQLTAEQIAYIKNQKSAQKAGMILGGVEMAANLLTAFFGNCASTNSVNSYSNSNTTNYTEKYSGSSSTVVNTEETEETPEQSNTEIEKEVKDILEKK